MHAASVGKGILLDLCVLVMSARVGEAASIALVQRVTAASQPQHLPQLSSEPRGVRKLSYIPLSSWRGAKVVWKNDFFRRFGDSFFFCFGSSSAHN